MLKNIAPYGSWKSPISSDLITSESKTLDQVHIDGDTIYWLEHRPSESGRSVIVRFRNDKTEDVNPPAFNARSRVHEYGGGVYCVHDDSVFFVNDRDQDIYRVIAGNDPERISHTERLRFADLHFDRRHDRILCVCEDHTHEHTEPLNCLVSIDIVSGAVITLCQGYNFYSNPRISTAGDRLCWLCWNHPNMPWDGTELWVADIDADGLPVDAVHIAGSDTVSIFQPEWSPDDTLYFVSDESGWWNLARFNQNGVTSVTALESEFGLPQWVFGQTTYAFSDHYIYCIHITDGIGQLSRLDLHNLGMLEIDIPQNSFASISANDNAVCFIAASENRFTQVIRINTGNMSTDLIATSCRISIDETYLSKGQNICFESCRQEKTYAVYYPPANGKCEAPEGELPPLIVLSHGGPTGATDASLDLRKQYWTSRGFALIDVNYSGSTGYGRKYRERLKYNWGIRDVEDVCDAARYLADKGIVDQNRLIIKGSSAGGYTVLAALTFHDIFTCGASYYGISDLEALLKDTHKFESHYTDRLVGSYPEHRQRYFQRSPIHFADHLSCPVIFFQGLEDRVVPSSQAEKMVAALENRGIAVSYVTFEHEQHGFRQAATIRAALEAELYFYSVIFGFETAEDLPRILIENINA